MNQSNVSPSYNSFVWQDAIQEASAEDEGSLGVDLLRESRGFNDSNSSFDTLPPKQEEQQSFKTFQQYQYQQHQNQQHQQILAGAGLFHQNNYSTSQYHHNQNHNNNNSTINKCRRKYDVTPNEISNSWNTQTQDRQRSQPPLQQYLSSQDRRWSMGDESAPFKYNSSSNDNNSFLSANQHSTCGGGWGNASAGTLTCTSYSGYSSSNTTINTPTYGSGGMLEQMQDMSERSYRRDAAGGGGGSSGATSIWATNSATGGGGDDHSRSSHTSISFVGSGGGKGGSPGAEKQENPGQQQQSLAVPFSPGLERLSLSSTNMSEPTSRGSLTAGRGIVQFDTSAFNSSCSSFSLSNTPVVPSFPFNSNATSSLPQAPSLIADEEYSSRVSFVAPCHSHDSSTMSHSPKQEQQHRVQQEPNVGAFYGSSSASTQSVPGLLPASSGSTKSTSAGTNATYGTTQGKGTYNKKQERSSSSLQAALNASNSSSQFLIPPPGFTVGGSQAGNSNFNQTDSRDKNKAEMELLDDLSARSVATNTSTGTASNCMNSRSSRASGGSRRGSQGAGRGAGNSSNNANNNKNRTRQRNNRRQKGRGGGSGSSNASNNSSSTGVPLKDHNNSDPSLSPVKDTARGSGCGFAGGSNHTTQTSNKQQRNLGSSPPTNSSYLSRTSLGRLVSSDTFSSSNSELQTSSVEALQQLLHQPSVVAMGADKTGETKSLFESQAPLSSYLESAPGQSSGLGLSAASNATFAGSSLATAMNTSLPPVAFSSSDSFPILPQHPPPMLVDDFSFGNDDSIDDEYFNFDDDDSFAEGAAGTRESGNASYGGGASISSMSPRSKKKEWLLRMNRKFHEIPIGELDPAAIPITAIMNAWAKTRSAQGASMVELWLQRVQQEADAGNTRIVPTTKMYTMAVDAWAGSGEGGAAAQRAEALLQQMYQLYQSDKYESLRPTTGVFNAVIKAWANSREVIAPVRAEQILDWMQTLQDLDVQPDKFTLNTTMHAYARAGGIEAAEKAQQLLSKMHSMYREGNILAKPDTISYNIVLNAIAKSGGRGAADEAEQLLNKMHQLHERGDPDIKPNVVSYGAVIDCFSKCGEPNAASRADTLLASMIRLHQSDPVRHAGLLPNTYVFNCCLNCWAKSKEPDAASKAEEMLVAMSRLHSSGMQSVKPDAFSYTACIDAWSKSGYRGAAVRAEQLLDKMEAKYLAGDADLKPNTYTYNAVISALAKSGETGAAARAERVLQNMVNRQRNGGGDAVKPTTINFNSILDAWAKSGGGRAAAERAEEILEWMDRLHKGGNKDVKPDTISFNAIIDAWARSGDRMAPRRAEQILDHMDELYRAGNKGVKPDTYTYNTLINCWAKSGERGAAARAEHVLSVMEKRCRDGDRDFKPNTRTLTSVIDAHAKSGEKGAARRAEQILNSMISRYDATGDSDNKPNVHTANAVCNACAFSKHDEDRAEALQIAFRVYDWLSKQPDMKPDSYTYTILLSVCANLLPREDGVNRFAYARMFFESCRDAGYVNDYVLRKLRQTVTDEEYLILVDYRTDISAMPASWTRNAKGGARCSKNANWNNRRGR